MKRLCSLFLILSLVLPAFADRRLSTPKNDFRGYKAYENQVIRAKSDANQAYVLGCACEAGNASGCSEDWFSVAAEGGVPDAQYKLGEERENRCDFFEAITWYKRAADKGVIEAKCKLAGFYLTGVSIKKGKSGGEDDEDEEGHFGGAVSGMARMGGGGRVERLAEFKSKCMTAEEWKAEEKSTLYVYEDIIPKDVDKALDIYKGYAKLNIPEVNYRVGMCFEQGLGLPKNKKKALELYEKATKQGHPAAKEALEEFKRRSDVEELKGGFAQ